MLQSLFAQSTATRFSESNALSQLFQTNAFVFLLSSILTALKQIYAPIDCLYDGMSDQQKTYVDSYCWRNYEHIVPQRVSLPPVPTMTMDARSSIPVRMPSISPGTVYFIRQPSQYRWFPLILLFQAFLAYLPSWLWKYTLRDRRLHETISAIKEPSKPHNRRKLLIINLANDLFTEGIQRRYAKPFFFCEVLNIISLVINVILTNFLLHNQFFLFGLSEIGMKFRRGASGSGGGNDLESDLFPTFAKCSVKLAKKASGSAIQIQKEEAICMVTFNSFCESIFMFFWIWFCILIIASLAGMSYRVFMLLSRRKRKKLLMQVVDKSFEEKLSQICEKLRFYSWFTLYRISRNVDPLTFQDIISSLMVRLDSNNTPTSTIYKTTKTMDSSTKDGSQAQHQQHQTPVTVTTAASTSTRSRSLATIV